MRLSTLPRLAVGFTILALAGCATVYNTAEVDQPPRAPREGVRTYQELLQNRGVAGAALLRLEIGEDGSVRRVERVHEEGGPVSPVVVPLVQNWKFTPAVKGGQPVACSIVMEFKSAHYSLPDPGRDWLRQVKSSYGEGAFSPGEVDSLPRPISRPPPRPPHGLRIHWQDANAVVGFIVGVDGRVHDARILEASDQEWGEAVLCAVSTWIFRPAMKNGVPVPTAMSMPVEINFSVR